MRLRQVALVASKLAPVVLDIRAVLGIEVGFNDPGVGTFGLENAVFPVGDTFLEVVAPVKEGTTAGRLLERRHGDGGYMVILQVDDLAKHRPRLEQLGVRIVWQTQLRDAATIHLHPKDVGAAILSLDWMDPADSWKWAGPDWKSKVRTDVVSEIVGVELQAGDPRALAERWAEVLGRRAERSGDEWRIGLDAGAIRFVRDEDGRGEGVSGVDLRATDRARVLEAARAHKAVLSGDEVRLCGTRFRLSAR
jgi:hypothetical protein